jgi:hypothetical protein
MLFGTIRCAARVGEANAGERVFVKPGEKHKDKFKRAARSVSECWCCKGFRGLGVIVRWILMDAATEGKWLGELDVLTARDRPIPPKNRPRA